VTSEDELLTAWALRLRVAESELREREDRALADDPTPAELTALAAERDRIALGRDRIADRYDEQAGRRDRSALGRDVSGSGRDQRARAPQQDEDPGWSDRFAAGADRDLAAGDRADSHGDRGRAHESRELAATDRRRAAVDRDRAARESGGQADEVRGLRAALESRHVIGQAQGLLMARYGVGSETAFAVLVRLSQTSNTKLRDLADQLVRAAEPEPRREPVGAGDVRPVSAEPHGSG
jgi:hypothetical protein